MPADPRFPGIYPDPSSYPSLQWDSQGRPYRLINGRVMFENPDAYSGPFAHSGTRERTDPRLMTWADERRRTMPRDNFYRETDGWDPITGKYKRKTNWGNVAVMAAADLITYGAASSLLGPATAVSPLINASGGAGPAVASGVGTGLGSTLPTLVPDFVSGVTATLPSASSALIPTIATTFAPVAADLIHPPNQQNTGGQPVTPSSPTAPTAPTSSPTSGPQPTVPGGDLINGSGAQGLDLNPGPSLAGRIMNFLGVSPQQLISNGVDYVLRLLQSRANNRLTEQQLASAREALEYARAQQEAQIKLEKERWDANEARRVPYRQASLQALAELKKMIGLPE